MRATASFRERVGGVSVVAAVFICLMCSPSSAGAAEWRVVPIRLDLGGDARTGSIRVIHETPDNLVLQLSLMEWAQDAEGKDRYSPSEDILYFPRVLVFSKDEERVVRAGIKVPAVQTEKSYRLFLEEVPAPGKGEGAQIAIVLRIGVPVFLKPLKENARAEIGPVGLARGTVGVLVKNTGNVHVMLRSVFFRGRNAKGEETYRKEVAGWYLLAGASRRYEAEIPNDVCGGLARLEADVSSDSFSLNGRLDVDPAMCGR